VLALLDAQMLRDLTILSGAGASGAGREPVESAQRLAAELVLVSAAAQAGTRAHIVGRSHGRCV